MNLKDFTIGVVTGMAAAVIVKEMSNRVAPFANPDQILANIKDEFKNTHQLMVLGFT